MKCTVITKELKTALKLHRLTTTAKNTFVLSGILIELKDDLFQIRSTDLENSLMSKIACVSHESGTKNSALVPYKSLKSIVDGHDEELIEFEVLQKDYIQDETETIKEAHYDEETQKWIQAVTKVKKVEVTEYRLRVGKFKLETMREEDFPLFPESNDKDNYTEIDWSLFIETLTKTKDFPSKDETRIILTSFLCDCENNCIVATDSYKLAKLTFDFSCKGKFNLSVYAYKLLKEKELKTNIAKFNFNENQIYFTIGNHSVVVRNFQGKFPEYEKLLPESTPYQFSFKSQDMIKRLNKLSKVFSEPGLPVKLTFFENVIKLEMTLKEIGTYEDTIECNITPALKEPFIVAFNPLFLKQCIEHFDTAIMHADDPLRPLLVKENNNEVYLIMPIRTE